MMDNILFLMQQHILYTEELLESTNKLEKICYSDDMTQITQEANNRQKILNLIIDTQNKIENKISQENLKLEEINLIRNWKQEFDDFSKIIKDKEEVIIEIIENKKKKISKEISSVYKNKESIGGYNLTNTKK